MASTTNNNSKDDTLVPPRFQPHPVECPECNLCKVGTECPQITHPYNFSGDIGLQCYMCSACSHGYTEPPAPSTTRPKDTWYVHIPIEEKCTSEIMQYRVALAEINSSKVTLYPNQKSVPKDDGALVVPVEFKNGSAAVILGIARERLRRKLRGLKHLYDLEKSLGLETHTQVVQ